MLQLTIKIGQYEFKNVTKLIINFGARFKYDVLKNKIHHQYVPNSIFWDKQNLSKLDNKARKIEARNDMLKNFDTVKFG